jgi:cyclopropane-fatty-acyl-phospholipid synthase
MSLIERAIHAFEDAPAPDFVSRTAVRLLVDGARRKLVAAPADAADAFAAAMGQRPIAECAERANEQHYELPSAFFEAVLGPRLKYSSCYYPTGRETLAEAETAALEETIAHAALADGQDVLELGCGWGSLSLFMARRHPASRIVSVSNSRPQKRFIEARAAAEGLTNLTVVTADMNDFAPEGRFDRVVSVEMFEHMANWRALLTRVRAWLKPEGRLFLHVFSHRAAPYRFDVEDPTDWIARHFFAGGVMPSHDLIRAFDDLFAVEADWRWSGEHYARTARHWLENMDAAPERVAEVLTETYGPAARVWRRRWRLFFLATEGLFACRSGREWGVSHYLLVPTRAA